MITDTKPAIGSWTDSATELPSKRAARAKHWVFNWRLSIMTAVVLGVAVPLVHFWHGYQVERNASGLLVLADGCEERKEWMKAAENLHRYLQLRPSDVETIVRMAEDFYKGAKLPMQKARVVQLYARALALAPDRDDLVRRQMVLRLEVGDHGAAKKQAEELLAKTPGDAESLRVQALALHQQWRLRRSVKTEELLEAYRAAIDTNPGGSDLAGGLAYFYRYEVQPTKEQGRAELDKLADAVMDRLVAESDKPAKTHVARYLYRQQLAKQTNTRLDSTALTELEAGANADLDAAMAADADKETFDVWLLAGERADAAQDYEAAIRYFRDAIKIDAADRRGYVGLGRAFSHHGEDEQAIEAWRGGLKVSPDDFDLPLLVASAEVRLGRWDVAEADIKRLENKLAPIPGPQAAELLASVYLLRGDWAIGQKKFAAALPPLKHALVLRQAGAESLTRAALLGQVLARIGQCYMTLNQWDQAALAFQRAADLLPREAALRFRAADAWETAGRYDEAVREYDAALVLDGVTAGAWVVAANAESLRQLSLPRAKRDWQSVANRVANARERLTEEHSAEPLLLTIVASECDAEQGLVEKAVERCREIETTALLSKSLVHRLILDYERWQRPDEADRLLEELRATTDGQLDHLLFASELLFRRNQHEEAYRLVTNALTEAKGDSRRAIEYRLAVMYFRDGKTEKAKPLLEHLAEEDKNNLRPLLILAELASQSGQVDKPNPYDAELESREGPEGVHWRYYRAQQLMLQANDMLPQVNDIAKDDPAAAAKSYQAAAKLYQQAAELQEQIESLRPAWPPGFTLKAKLAESRSSMESNGGSGDDATAIQAYTQAIRLGARNLSVYDALTRLLYRQGRTAEANLYIDHWREMGPLPDELSNVAMAIDIRSGNSERAIALAREQVAAEPDDAMRHLRLGVLLACPARIGETVVPDKLAEAEVELKRARELSPTDARMWDTLLSLYTSSNRTDEASALLAEAEKTNVLGKEETPFFLAQGYEALKNEEKAASYYSQAADAAPNRQAVQYRSALYFFKRNAQLAEKYLRRTLEIESDHRGAAGLLAILLAPQEGTEREIDQLLSDGQIEPKDQTLHAVLLLRRGTQESRRQAQQILESLAGDLHHQAAPIDRLLLARMYEAQAALAAARGESKSAETNLGAAREQLKALANREHPAAEHLALYIDNLLRTGRAADVAGRLDELATLEPETSSLRTLSLRLRWLKDQQKEGQARGLIDSYVESRLKAVTDKSAQARLLQAAAGLYSTYDLPKDAEQALRRAIELDTSAAATLVTWLVKQERMSDAVQFCVELAQNSSASVSAIILANALAIGKPSEKDVLAAAPVIERALEDHPEDPNLLFAVSVRQLMDGNNEESIRLLRKVIKREPRHVAAMNNLAFLLSMKPDGRDEAGELMAKVIALSGGNAELVDSKGWVLMQQQKLTEAVDAFQEALTRSPADPRYHFHLALAYQLQGKVKEAREALKIARRSGIESAMMPPDERSALAQLETVLP